MRLLPLLHVEDVLIRRLTPSGSQELEATHLAPASGLPGARPPRGKEVSVGAGSAWKSTFTKLLAPRASQDGEGDDIDLDDPQDPGRVLHACGEDMRTLWGDKTIRALLRSQKLRLEEMPGL